MHSLRLMSFTLAEDITSPFNAWGFDQGIPAQMERGDDGKWELEIMATWPMYVQLNVWGYDDYYYGDTDGDGIMDRLPPDIHPFFSPSGAEQSRRMISEVTSVPHS